MQPRFTGGYHNSKSLVSSNISQIGTCTYNAVKVLSDYQRQLCQDEYKINYTQTFAVNVKEKPPLDEDKEYVSYDVDSLFTNTTNKKPFSEDYCAK